MEIKEAIDTLKNKICDYVIPNYCNDCENKSECLDDCNFILSIYTILQEIEHLQKENEKLRVLKYKIIDKIEELNKKEKEELKGTKGSDRYHIKLEYMYKKNVLQDLLKEEKEK